MTIDNASEEAKDEDLKISLRSLWNAKVPQKIQTFVWRLFLNRLPTKDHIAKRGILSGARYQFYALLFEENEDFHHLFLRSPIYEKYLEAIDFWLGINSMVDFNSRASFIRHSNLLRKSARNSKQGLVWLSTCWSI